MFPRITALGVLALVLALALTSCAPMGGPEQEVAAKILGRRIGYHGVQAWPPTFKELGKIAHSACEAIEDKDKALKGAFQTIAHVIAEELNDPLVEDDLMDIIELIGFDLDADYNILGITEEQMALLEGFICYFAVGVVKGGG